MKTNSPPGLPGGRAALAITLLAAIGGTASAQQQGYGQAPAYPPPYASQYQTPPGLPGSGYQSQQAYPQQSYPPPQYGQTQYVSPLQFLPTVGRRFGDMFRRVFYGDAPPPGYQGYPPQGGGNLDAAPPNYPPRYGSPPPPAYPQQTYPPQQSYPQQQAYPQQPSLPPASGTAPRYEMAPPPIGSRSSGSALPPSSRTNGGSSTAPRTSITKKPATTPTQTPPKYTPPTLSRDTPPAPKLEQQPPSPPKETVRTEPREYAPLPGSKPSATGSESKSGGNATAGSGSFLKGKRTGKDGRVISPYPPYQELDVTGLSSGSLALDPTTQKVFEVP